MASGWLATVVIVALPCIAAAQGVYPMRVVRVVVPSSSGAGGDTIARVLAQGLAERLGRQVIIDNRPGASTMIGGEAVGVEAAAGDADQGRPGAEPSADELVVDSGKLRDGGRRAGNG